MKRILIVVVATILVISGVVLWTVRRNNNPTTQPAKQKTNSIQKNEATDTSGYQILDSKDALDTYQTKQKKPLTVPELDWKDQKLVAIAYRVPTPGYSIISAKYDSSKNAVTMTVQGPPQNCSQVQIITTLQTLVVVPGSVTTLSIDTVPQLNPASCP